MEMQFVTRELFGGAASVDVPLDYYDVSSLRQVPDHQEVYQEKDGFDHIIIEIMEHVPNVTSTAAARFHLEDYADTDGRELKIWQTEEVQMPRLPLNTSVVAMFATTPAPQPGKDVGIFLLTVRLPEHDTDLLITMNVKNASTNNAADYQALFAEGGDQGLAKGREAIQRVVRSFEMKDYSLFHPED